MKFAKQHGMTVTEDCNFDMALEYLMSCYC